MPTYKFDTVATIGDGHEIEFSCEAKYNYHPAYNGRGMLPDEDSSVTILSIWGHRVERDAEAGPAINLGFLECDGLRDEICAHHEQEREYARESAAEARWEAMREERA